MNSFCFVLLLTVVTYCFTYILYICIFVAEIIAIICVTDNSIPVCIVDNRLHTYVHVCCLLACKAS